MSALVLSAAPCAAAAGDIRLFRNPLEAGTLGRWREFGIGMGQPQKALAKKADTSQGYISRLENGWQTPKRARWKELMDAYRIKQESVWIALLNATRAERVLRTPATVSEPLFCQAVQNAIGRIG